MKIGGRIIQDKNISANTDEQFSATYKNHYIEVALHRREKGRNPDWSCEIWHFNGTYAVQTIVRRCTIHDAIIYALEGALL